MRFVRLCFVLLVASIAGADPPPGGTPPPVNCGARAPLTVGMLKDGHYLALEPIDPAQTQPYREKGDKWFHEVIATVSGGKVSTVENPIVQRRGRRLES